MMPGSELFVEVGALLSVAMDELICDWLMDASVQTRSGPDYAVTARWKDSNLLCSERRGYGEEQLARHAVGVSPGTAGTGGLLIRGGRSSGQLSRCGILGRLHGGLMPAVRLDRVVGCGADTQLAIDGDQAAAVADPDGHALPPVGEQFGC
jgi:hypothetical protein